MIFHAHAITNLTDARYFAAKDVAYLGFHLEAGSPESLDPIFMKAMKEWVEGPAITGWYMQTPVSEIADAAAFFGLDAVVLPLNPTNLAEIGALGDLRYLFFLPNDAQNEPQISMVGQLDSLAHAPEAIIIRIESNLSEQMVEEVGEICRRRKTLLQLAEPTAEAVRYWHKLLAPAGFCLSGGAEEKTGVKTFDDLEDIFDYAESVENDA